jgi:hypothetical protein
MKMGIRIENGTIRLIIGTTNRHVCYLRDVTATTDWRQTSSIRRPGPQLGSPTFSSDMILPTLFWFLLRGFLQKGPARLFGVSP